MLWIFISNFIMLVMGYEILRKQNSELTKKVVFTEWEWLLTKSSEGYVGWLLAGNFHKDIKNNKAKFFFEISRIYLVCSIILFTGIYTLKTIN